MPYIATDKIERLEDEIQELDANLLEGKAQDVLEFIEELQGVIEQAQDALNLLREEAEKFTSKRDIIQEQISSLKV